MKIRKIATLSTLMLTAVAGTKAFAEEPVALAWQEPGYVMDVVVATAPRPTMVIYADEAALADPALAWKEPGYVMDVVVARASRSEALARVRAAETRVALIREALGAEGVVGPTLGVPTH